MAEDFQIGILCPKNCQYLYTVKTGCDHKNAWEEPKISRGFERISTQTR